MFNIAANIGSQRFNLTSLAKDMGLGGQRQREETAAQSSMAWKQIPGEQSVDSEPEQALPEPATEPGDEIGRAHLLAAEQRKAAESLLLEARTLEKRLLDESAKAREARERSGELAAEVSRTVAAEQEARGRVRTAAERQALVTTERRQIEAVLLASRRATEAATTEIAELKRRLENVLQVATEASDLLRAQDQRAAEAASAATAAEKELSDANAQLAQRQAEREAAEREAAPAKERTASNGKIVQTISPSSSIPTNPAREPFGHAEAGANANDA
ncbi:MAG: hypothetical protein ABI231_02365 [Candidatus Tumulicola sp.]